MNEDLKPTRPPIDEDIEPDTSDIPELSEQVWARAEVGKFYRARQNASKLGFETSSKGFDATSE